MQTSQPLSFKLILLVTSEYVTRRNDNSLLLLFFFCPLPFLVQILPATQICSYFVYCILFLLICFQVLCFFCVSRIFFNHYCCFCCVFNLLLLFFLSYLSRKLSLDHGNNNNDSSHVKKVITLTQSQNFFFSYIS